MRLENWRQKAFILTMIVSVQALIHCGFCGELIK